MADQQFELVKLVVNAHDTGSPNFVALFYTRKGDADPAMERPIATYADFEEFTKVSFAREKELYPKGLSGPMETAFTGIARFLNPSVVVLSDDEGPITTSTGSMYTWAKTS